MSFFSLEDAVARIVKNLLKEIGDDKLKVSEDVINYAFSNMGDDVIRAVCKAIKPCVGDLLVGLSRNEDLASVSAIAFLIRVLQECLYKLMPIKLGDLRAGHANNQARGLYGRFVFGFTAS